MHSVVCMDPFLMLITSLFCALLRGEGAMELVTVCVKGLIYAALKIIITMSTFGNQTKNKKNTLLEEICCRLSF